VNKSRTFLLFFLFFIFPSLLAARNVSDITTDTFEETAGRGLVINTNPSAVKVFIDGVERGSTPVTFENMPRGEYSIRLSREGYRDRQFSVTLFNNSRLVVSIKMEELRGFVNVTVHRADDSPQTLPFNPQLFTDAFDGTLSAVSLTDDYKALLNLTAGHNFIIVRAFGWEEALEGVLVSEETTAEVDIYMIPAAFRIGALFRGRKRINPLDSSGLGSAEYRFIVMAPGSAVMTVRDTGGSVVYSRQLDDFSTWRQSVTWDGRDIYGNPVPEGVYTVLIEASPLFPLDEGEEKVFQLTMQSEVDYSIDLFPLSLTGGTPGLMFAPLPHVLPAESYQIEAEILFGNFLFQESAGVTAIVGFPFGIGLRVSPFKRLETAAFFNVNPRVDNSTGFGISGSVKYNFLNGGAFPLALAAGVNYAWAGRNGDDPLSPGRGVGLYIPLSLELAGFSVIISPAIFWRGPEGIIPAFLLSAGALYRGGWFSTGLSARVEFDFTENSGNPKFLAGLQAYFFPPPSNLFFSAKAGIWTKDSQTGGYGGAGIGLIY
jgi:hypothetical protein